MSDTITKADIQASFPNNITGQIRPIHLRNFSEAVVYNEDLTAILDPYALADLSNVDMSSYVTQDQLAGKQDAGSYVTNSEFLVAITPLATTSALTSGLATKVDTTTLANYATTSSVTSVLANKQDKGNYAESAELANYATVASLANYATVASMANYETTSALNSALSNYATNLSMSSALSAKADVSSLANYATTSALAAKADSTDFRFTDSRQPSTITWIIENPVVGGKFGPRIKTTSTVSRIDYFCVGNTGVSFNIEDRSSVGSSGTNLHSSEMTAYTTAAYTTPSSPTVTAGHWLYCDISALNGTPSILIITLTI